MDRFIAMEGIISRFMNRKVQPAKRILRNNESMTNYRNVDELYQAAAASKKNTYGRRSTEGLIEGLPFILELEDDAISGSRAMSILKKNTAVDW